MKLYVSEICRSISQKFPEEEFGDWYAEYDNQITGVSTSKESWREEEFDVPFEASVGDTVYVLYMTYSSGDSFGRSEGNSKIIWIFKDKSLAYEAHAVYDTASNDTYNNSDTLDVVIDNGQVLSLSNPSAGYFENMSSCTVEEFVLS